MSHRLNVETGRLCLIPTDAGEKLCYEFRGEYGGHTYLCYISAETGAQEQLLRVIEDEAGLWLDCGHIFGKPGEGFIRINIATQRAYLDRAATQLVDAVKRHV